MHIRLGESVFSFNAMTCFGNVTLKQKCQLGRVVNTRTATAAYSIRPCLFYTTLPTLYDPAYSIRPCLLYTTLPTLYTTCSCWTAFRGGTCLAHPLKICISEKLFIRHACCSSSCTKECLKEVTCSFCCCCPQSFTHGMCR